MEQQQQQQLSGARSLPEELAGVPQSVLEVRLCGAAAQWAGRPSAPGRADRDAVWAAADGTAPLHVYAALPQEYVLQRLRRFAPEFAAELVPHGSSHDIEGALLRTLQRTGPADAASAAVAAASAGTAGTAAGAAAARADSVSGGLGLDGVLQPAPSGGPGQLRFTHDCK
jgi:hypothetical protein